MSGIEYVLFLILGWCVFVDGPPGKLVAMVVYVVVMVLWLVAGVSGFKLPHF